MFRFVDVMAFINAGLFMCAVYWNYRGLRRLPPSHQALQNAFRNALMVLGLVLLFTVVEDQIFFPRESAYFDVEQSNAERELRQIKKAWFGFEMIVAYMLGAYLLERTCRSLMIAQTKQPAVSPLLDNAQERGLPR